MENLGVASDVRLGRNVRLSKFVNLYGCSIGDNCKVGSFVEIQKNVTIANSCKVQSHTFICEGVSVGEGCFIGHGVTFINDRYPRSTNPDGKLQNEQDWELVRTVVEERASIGSGATILCGVVIGKGAMVGAGSVVTGDVEAGTVVAGNPARFIRRIDG
ncbi:N-acetylglucosamine-1-phosphate uridyltransferase [Chitinispirillum alkaliphilum]|nr:N-acetylglucosamine-1-phosphate uridyltransferase [Chitinispirillum alkaliphilum]